MNEKKRKIVKKIEISVASLCTFGLALGVVVYAWFNHEREIAKMQKVKAPDQLYINAAHAEDVVYFKLSGIEYNTHWKKPDNTEDDVCYYKDYVFSVSGEYVSTFTLQLAHTTNNEFTYKIYEANRSLTIPTDGSGAQKIYGKDYVAYTLQYDEDGNEIFGDEAPVFSPIKVSDEENAAKASIVYYTKGDELHSDSESWDIPQKYLNPKSGSTVLANDNKNEDVFEIYEDTYGDYSNFEAHAMPLYWQKTGIPSSDDPDAESKREPFYKEFILHIEWNAKAKLLKQIKKRI